VLFFSSSNVVDTCAALLPLKQRMGGPLFFFLNTSHHRLATVTRNDEKQTLSTSLQVAIIAV
jgi:hypothetical protein